MSVFDLGIVGEAVSGMEFLLAIVVSTLSLSVAFSPTGMPRFVEDARPSVAEPPRLDLAGTGTDSVLMSWQKCGTLGSDHDWPQGHVEGASSRSSGMVSHELRARSQIKWLGDS